MHNGLESYFAFDILVALVIPKRMELFSLRMVGFKRFSRQADLRTNGKLVALVGRNEAGKSTVLQALTSLSNDEEIAEFDLSRGADRASMKLEARYLLNKEELELAKLSGPRWLLVQKQKDGKRRFGFEPDAPERDISKRDLVYREFVSITNNDDLRESLNVEYPELIDQIVETLVPTIGNQASLDHAIRTKLKSQRDHFAAAFDLGKNKVVRDFIEDWTTMLEIEAAPSPWLYAVNQLKPLIPESLQFGEEDRNLESVYSIGAIRTTIPKALQNFCDIAGLNLKELFAIIDAGNIPALTTLEHKVNKALAAKFEESWKQSGISVAIRLSSATLEIQIVNEESEFSALAERSDGLRQFVALQAFALRNRGANPILLIDEAEQRLHYDAQADLIQMLSRQCISPKIIYTTHSAGCLPEDLGNGVRLVAQDSEERTRSRIINKFWAESSDGLSPLLIGMGASTLAFFPTRRAVMVEGAADMLLYPPMFREALSVDTLGFQFIPGLASNGIALAKESVLAENQVLYLVDGDESGIAIAARLRDVGISPGRILLLRNADSTAVELEDFIRLELLLDAANNLIGRHHPGSTQILQTEIGSKRRMSKLQAIYTDRTGSSLPKIEFAYEMLENLDRHPGTGLLDRRRMSAFAKVIAPLRAFFKV